MEFNWMELLYQLFEIVLIPLLGILTAYAVKLIKSKTEEIKVKHDNQLLNKYLDMLQVTVTDCVTATTQTYVDRLKKEGKFTEAAHKDAFDMTFNNILTILGDDAKEYLTEAVGDLDSYIATKIEAEISRTK